MTARDWIWAGAAGIVLGASYVLSPMAIWFAAATAALLVWAGRGLGTSERRWVMAMLVVAVALRVAAVAGLFLASEHRGMVFDSFPFDGDGQYMKLRAVLIRHAWAGVPIDETWALNAWDREYGWSSYLLVLAYVQLLVGPAPFGVHLFNIVLATAGSVLLYRTMRRGYGSAVALCGLGFILFIPSLFLWSISAMKESFQFFLTATGLAATIGAYRARSVLGRGGALVVAILSVAALATVRREIAVAISLGGTLVGLFAFLATRRLAFCVAAILALVVGASELRRPDNYDRLVKVLKPAAEAQIGTVYTPGHSYKLLEERFYWGDSVQSMTFRELGRYVWRALVAFVTVPLPWQISSKPELAFLPVQLLWYLLVAFALAGVVPGMRKDAVTTCLLCGYIVVGAAAIALGSGNVGTLVRHRDIVTPFVVWLSVLGIESTFGRVAGYAVDNGNSVRVGDRMETVCL